MDGYLTDTQLRTAITAVGTWKTRWASPLAQLTSSRRVYGVRSAPDTKVHVETQKRVPWGACGL